MSVFGFLGKVKKVLGKITDFLVKGREAGLWSEDQKTDPKGNPHYPTFPDLK